MTCRSNGRLCDAFASARVSIEVAVATANAGGVSRMWLNTGAFGVLFASIVVVIWALMVF